MDYFKKAKEALDNANFVETFNFLQKAGVKKYEYARFEQEFTNNQIDYAFVQRLTVFINAEEEKAQIEEKKAKNELLEVFEKLAKASQFQLKEEKPFTFQGKILNVSFNDEKDYEYQLHKKIAISIRAGRPLGGQVFAQLKDQDFSFFNIEKREKPETIEVNKTDDWALFIKEAKIFVDSLVQKTTPQEVHIFLGVPVALAMGLGAAIGTYHNLRVYHFQENCYHQVLTLSQSLR